MPLWPIFSLRGNLTLAYCIPIARKVKGLAERGIAGLDIACFVEASGLNIDIKVDLLERTA
jgi:hypothetical protein